MKRHHYSVKKLALPDWGINCVHAGYASPLRCVSFILSLSHGRCAAAVLYIRTCHQMCITVIHSRKESKTKTQLAPVWVMLAKNCPYQSTNNSIRSILTNFNKYTSSSGCGGPVADSCRKMWELWSIEEMLVFAFDLWEKHIFWLFSFISRYISICSVMFMQWCKKEK